MPFPPIQELFTHKHKYIYLVFKNLFRESVEAFSSPLMLTLTAIDLGAVAINSLLGMKLEALSTFNEYFLDESII